MPPVAAVPHGKSADPTHGSASTLPTGSSGVPINPSKIVGIGRNYRDHAKELGNDVPKTPLYFLKAPSSLLAHGGTVLLPPESERVDYEAELGVVIGKTARRVTAQTALEYVAGYLVT